MKDRILIVEPESQFRAFLREQLEDRDFSTIEAVNSSDISSLIKGGSVDLILLEPNFAREDGFRLVRDVVDFQVPIIVVSDRNRTINRIIGLEMGADDYVGKPVDADELAARIRAVLRRTRAREARSSLPNGFSDAGIGPVVAASFEFDGWVFNVARRELKDPTGTMIELTSMEIDLLFALVSSAQVPIPREKILEKLGRTDTAGSARSIDVLVSKLRRKIERNGKTMIKTVRGSGYVFSADTKIYHGSVA